MKNAMRRFLLILLAVLLAFGAVVALPGFTAQAYAMSEGDELIRDADGITRLYRNGSTISSYTGLYEYSDGRFYYIKQGVWQENYRGLYEHSKNGKFYYIKGGIWQEGYRGLYEHSINGKFYYLKNGIWQNVYNGLYEHSINGKFYYIRNGIWQNNYNGLYEHSKNGWFYYLKNGIWQNNYSGLYEHSKNGWFYYLKNGLWQSNYNGLYEHSKNGWFYYLKNGIWQSNFTGLYEHSKNHDLYYLKKGLWQKGKELVYTQPSDGRHYYIYNGIWTVRTKIFKDGESEYHIENGFAKVGLIVIPALEELPEEWYFADPETGKVVKKEGFISFDGNRYYVSGDGGKLYRKYDFTIDGVNYGAWEDCTIFQYSNSSLAEGYIQAYKYKPRYGTPVKKITIHHMAGVMTAKSCGNYFATPQPSASSQYGIGYNGEIYQYVDEKDRSCCSADDDNDRQAINIEVSNSSYGGNWPISQASLDSLINLCVDICLRNNIEKLVFTGDATGNLTMHKYFMPTNCPSAYLESKFPYIAQEVNRRLEIERNK